MPNVTITAFDGLSAITDITDANGDYSLTGFGIGPYTITPSKTPYAVNSFNGIFSNDASRIAQHVVGLITLSDDQLKAARVSGLPTVSSFDAALVAQHLVGITNPINKTGQWVFTPESTMPDTTQDNVQDYEATLFGDVNGDWDPAGARPAGALIDLERIGRAVHVTVGSHRAVSSTEIIIPLKIENLRGTGVTSYQFDIEYDPAVLSPAQVIADLSGTIGEGLAIAYNAPEPGLIKVVAFGAFPVMGDGTYVNLRFRVDGKSGAKSSLVITNFRFNDGSADIVTTDGDVRVGRVMVGKSQTED